MIRNRALSAAFLAAALAVPGMASAQNATQPYQTQPYQQQSTTQIPLGTTVTGSLQGTINTKTAQVGDPFTMIVSGASSGDASLNGARVDGHVAEVQRAGQGRPAKLQLAFDRATLSNGTTLPVRGDVVSMKEKNNESSAARGIAGAVIGNIAGNYLGKHLGTNMGGLIGAAGGYMYANNAKVDFSVPSGTQVTMKVTGPAQRNQGRNDGQ